MTELFFVDPFVSAFPDESPNPHRAETPYKRPLTCEPAAVDGRSENVIQREHAFGNLTSNRESKTVAQAFLPVPETLNSRTEMSVPLVFSVPPGFQPVANGRVLAHRIDHIERQTTPAGSRSKPLSGHGNDSFQKHGWQDQRDDRGRRCCAAGVTESHGGVDEDDVQQHEADRLLQSNRLLTANRR